MTSQVMADVGGPDVLLAVDPQAVGLLHEPLAPRAEVFPVAVFDDVLLTCALECAEEGTPTALFVIARDVNEPDAVGILRQVSALCRNAIEVGVDCIDVHIGEESSQCGVTYLRGTRQLIVSSESVAQLRCAIDSLALSPVFGDRNWLVVRVPTLEVRGERAVDTHTAMAFGQLALDLLLEAVGEDERESTM